jgi:RNA polymerase sigma factor (sigma-70 family)
MTDTEKAEMAEQNMPLIWYVIRQFHFTGLDPDEMYSVALAGLAKALALFDDARNVKFCTFAILCIKTEILIAIRKEKKHLRNVPYDAVVPSTENIALVDMLPADTDVANEVTTKIALRGALTALNDRERDMLMQSANGRLQDDIGRQYGISQSLTSRIVTGAKKKIRRELYSV